MTDAAKIPDAVWGALKGSGFPFQTAVAQVVTSTAGAWKIVASEYPWESVDGERHFLDLVVTNETFYLTIECKKTRKDIFTFLRPLGLGNTGDVLDFRCLRAERGGMTGGCTWGQAGRENPPLTRGGERRVPTMAVYVAYALLKFVEEQRAAGHERIFSELGQDTHGAWSGAFSKWYGRHLRNVVGISDPRLTFYSFRHTMKDAMRAALIPDSVQRAILGHAGVGVADSYGLGFPIRVLATELAKVRFDLPAGPRSS